MAGYNAANKEHIADKQRLAKADRDSEIADLRAVLNTPQGIRVFSRILERGRIFSTSFTGNSHTFFNEGMRNMALLIFADVCEAAQDKIQTLIMKIKEGESDD